MGVSWLVMREKLADLIIIVVVTAVINGLL